MVLLSFGRRPRLLPYSTQRLRRLKDGFTGEELGHGVNEWVGDVILKIC